MDNPWEGQRILFTVYNILQYVCLTVQMMEIGMASPDGSGGGVSWASVVGGGVARGRAKGSRSGGACGADVMDSRGGGRGGAVMRDGRGDEMATGGCDGGRGGDVIDSRGDETAKDGRGGGRGAAVSYTHLTLPTIYSV